MAIPIAYIKEKDDDQSDLDAVTDSAQYTLKPMTRAYASTARYTYTDFHAKHLLPVLLG